MNQTSITLQKVAHNILNDYVKVSEKQEEDKRQLMLIIKKEIDAGNNIQSIHDTIKNLKGKCGNSMWDDILYYIEQLYHHKQYERENNLLDAIDMWFTHGPKLSIRSRINKNRVEYVNFIYDDSCIIFQPDIIKDDGTTTMVTTAIIPRNLFFRYYLNFYGQVSMANMLDVAEISCHDIYGFETPIGNEDIRNINTGILIEISNIKS